MTLPLTPTETLALAQGVRRNEERYERLDHLLQRLQQEEHNNEQAESDR